MELKYPIEYELHPESVDEGTHSIAIKLRNVGNEDLEYVKVDLNSLDGHGLVVYGTYKTIAKINHGETEEVSFEVDASRRTNVYIILTATVGQNSFYWESPPITIAVGKEKAQLEGLFILTHPHPAVDTTCDIEAIIRSLEDSEGLKLEFWVETPKGVSEQLARISVKELTAGEEVPIYTEVRFSEEGYYTVHAYLYDEDRRIDYKSDTVLVKQLPR